MSTAFDQVLQAALTLSPQARADLVDSLIATLDTDENAPLDHAWLAEIERRSAEIDSGAVQLLTWAEVRKRVTGR